MRFWRVLDMSVPLVAVLPVAVPLEAAVSRCDLPAPMARVSCLESLLACDSFDLPRSLLNAFLVASPSLLMPFLALLPSSEADCEACPLLLAGVLAASFCANAEPAKTTAEARTMGANFICVPFHDRIDDFHQTPSTV